MLPRDVEEFLALDYLEDLDPTLVYLASPFAHESAEVREARLEAVRHVCGKMIDQGRIVLSPLVYAGELAERGFRMHRRAGTRGTCNSWPAPTSCWCCSFPAGSAAGACWWRLPPPRP